MPDSSKFINFNMPKSYSINLRWRIVWAYLTQGLSLSSVCYHLQFTYGLYNETMHHIAIQRSDKLRARFRAEVSVCDDDAGLA